MSGRRSDCILTDGLVLRNDVFFVTTRSLFRYLQHSLLEKLISLRLPTTRTTLTILKVIIQVLCLSR